MTDGHGKIADKLMKATPDERDEAVAIGHKKTECFVWAPNSGPQTDAYRCAADELFYGGQAGGGKTDLGLGLALTAHKRSLILRRVNKDALKLVERVAEILGHRSGYNGQLQRWKLNDRMIVFSGCEYEDDKQRFKGDPHDLICVGRGTLILMADGSLMPVEELSVGDEVKTLEGPRRVKRTFPPRYKPSIRVTAFDEDGRILGSQVQSSNHELLAPGGWHPLVSGGAPDVVCRPTEFDSGGKSLLELRQSNRLTLPLRGVKPYHFWHSVWRALSSSGRLIGAAPAAFLVPPFPETCFAASCGGHAETRQRLLSSDPEGRPQLVPPLSASGDSFYSYDASDAQRMSLLADLRGRYWFGNRQCDERTHALLDRHIAPSGGQLYLHRLCDAVTQPHAF